MNIFYVYALYDPETDEIFYVGKGKDYRDKSHFKPHLWKNPKNTTNPFLYYKIKSIMEQNKIPKIKRLKEHLSENSAYELETELIQKYGRRFSEENGKLFNILNQKEISNAGKHIIWSEERKIKHIERCKNKRIYDPTYEIIYDDYITKKKTRKTIALENKCSEVLVKKRLEYYGIIKPKHVIYPPKNTHVCIKCNNKFNTPKSVKNRKYCSRKCMKEDKYG